MYGDIFSDSIISDLKRTVNSLLETIQSERKTHSEMISANAENLGVRFALATQLKLADPENPLVNDLSLLARVGSSARKEFKVNSNFDAACDAGRSFPVPGRDKETILAARRDLSNQPKPDEATAYAEAYAGTIALRNALAGQLGQLDPNNPLLQDLMLIERIRAAGTAAYKICGNDLTAAREVGNNFKVPGRS